MNRNISCCFFGHRNVRCTQKLKDRVYKTIEELITTKGITIFLFGSKSKFDDLCYCIVSELKTKYTHIIRIYVRAEYPYINDEYKNYLLDFYEDTYYPNEILNAGRAVYIERNYIMIDQCDYCVVYYDERYTQKRSSNSGTKLAYEYAIKKHKNVYNVEIETI